ncbi:N-methyl-L-tryptophan oxidase [Planctomyces sp. SH-PL14]|uniref:N-methyl-L-tryptophan oxidase n=1 Tax=Planctomyces sp. SH-PL14 TaxID=1632864 RepID=UPI00078E77F5|nr:N-methyl-L-tryptophan oxidase [Planctomyces sp. SH-PL14]AMV18064.1 Monomeric sarcosine oxidase [Planctomyces sp. SH-PL14]
MERHWGVIVIGLGGMGSAACVELARRGVRVLGLEQHAAAHDRGSSHGETRIIRQCYFEHPDYVPLLLRAYELWGRLEQDSGRRLYRQTGLLISGTPDGEAVAGARDAARKHGLPLHDLSAAEVAQRFPWFRSPEGHAAVFEERAGYLAVEECVRAHWQVARAAGAELREREPVVDWQATDSGVVVRTAQGTYEADRLIIAAGAWSGPLLRDLDVTLRVVRKVSGWFPIAGPMVHPDTACPTYYFELDDGAFYGFPSLDGATIKVAEHSGGEPVADPATVDRTVRPDDVASLQRFLSRVVPEAATTPARTSVCLYTLSADHHFVIDRHPAHSRVVFAAGFSGHGFKFCPVIGEVLADLALNGATALPIGFLGLSRFESGGELPL